MITLNLAELCVRLNARLIGANTGISIDSVSSDSRNLPANCLFVALKGDSFDGHDFATVAIENGAIALLVERELALNVPQLLVNDTQQAMGNIGAYVCEQVKPKTVALTGSNGKTTVKEMVATILSQQHQVLFTAGNFNNEIGVPLTLLRLKQGDEYGVFELGANHKGEIGRTSALVQPHVALVNNVAAAHIEGFGSLAGVAEAKAEIFNHLRAGGTAIINADDPFSAVMLDKSKQFKQLTFSVDSVSSSDSGSVSGKSLDADADVRATHLLADNLGRYRFTLNLGGERAVVQLPLSGRHQVSNALAASAICFALGLGFDEIIHGLSLLQPVKGRMQPTQLGRVRLIDDSYNANPASVGVAIDWLEQMSGVRALVLGDLGELGDNAAQIHTELGLRAKHQGLDAMLTLGALSINASTAFGGEHYQDIAPLVANLINFIKQQQADVTVLIKGSRSARMERVVDALILAYGRGEFA